MTTLIVIVLFVLGVLLGRLLTNADKMRLLVEKLVTWSIWALLFLMGISVGINKMVIGNFDQIGYLAVLITLGAVTGSVVLCALVFRFMFRSTTSRKEVR